jgi:hypothetical protein
MLRQVTLLTKSPCLVHLAPTHGELILDLEVNNHVFPLVTDPALAVGRGLGQDPVADSGLLQVRIILWGRWAVD